MVTCLCVHVCVCGCSYAFACEAGQQVRVQEEDRQGVEAAEMQVEACPGYILNLALVL